MRGSCKKPIPAIEWHHTHETQGLQTMENVKYPPLMRALHWLMAVALLGMIAVGWYMSELPKEDPMRMTLFGYHKMTGVLLLVTALVRWSVRRVLPHPALPPEIPARDAKLAQAGHGALYVLMIAIPLVGLALSNGAGYGVNIFGWDMPMLFPKNKELAEMAEEAHGVLAYGLLALVGVHAGAVLIHAKRHGVNLLRRMW